MGNEKTFSGTETSSMEGGKADITKYEDPTGLSAKNLNIGLWLADNKRLINKIIIVTLSFFSALMVLYSLYGYFYYFTFGREQEKILEQQRDSLDIASYRDNNSPKDLEASDVQAISSEGSYGLVAKIKNPNARHYAIVNYCFLLGADQKCSNSFVLPGEEKLVILPNQKSEEAVNDIKFKIDSISWQRINARNIPHWEAYKTDRLNFSVTGLKTSVYNNLTYLEFDIANNSAFSYYEVPLNIIARGNGDNITAINRYVLTDFKSGENKSVRLYWPGLSQYMSPIDIVVDLNITDQNIYKPYNEY